MNRKDVEILLKPQFGKLGKSSGEQLWAHHYNVWFIAEKILNYFNSISKDIKQNIEIACLVHDIGKMATEHQIFYQGINKKPKKHRFELNDLENYLSPINEKLSINIDNDSLQQIYEIARIHHYVSDEDLKTATFSQFGIYSEILRVSDWLASAERIDFDLIIKIREKYEPFFDLSFFTISRMQSPTTSLIQNQAIECFVSNNWKILSFYNNGVILIGDKESRIPGKSEIINKFNSKLISDFLRYQDCTIYSTTGQFLVGAANKYPYDFINSHVDFITEKLGNVDENFLYFLKILDSLLYLDKWFNSWQSELNILKIIHSCGGPRGMPNARNTWQKVSGEYIDKPKDIYKQIFLSKKLSDCIPGDIIEIELDKNINSCQPKELLDILLLIAQKYNVAEENTSMDEFLSSIFNIEEQVNFKANAHSIFEKYKEYKKSSNPKKGVCERCGNTLSIEAHKGLKFQNTYGFSQIKAKKNVWQATCSYCAYDNLIMHKYIGKNKPIIITIKAKTLPIIEFTLLKNIINIFWQGINSMYQFSSIIEFDSDNIIPFADKLRLPRPNKMKDVNIDILKQNEFGIQFCLPLNIGKAYKASLKDKKVRLKPIYHFLKLLGYHVNIGEEEQYGLFGEYFVSTIESYYQSLATTILSQALYGEQRHLKAERLIIQTPSLAVSIMGDDKLKIKKELVNHFFNIMSQSEQIIHFNKKEENYTMKFLLEDAVFFAENIPKFCWTNEDWNKWYKNASKHSATKPISASMNELLQGRTSEEAYAKFLSYIRHDIAKEKSEKAKTDVIELKTFLEAYKEKIDKYQQIRDENMSDFIRIKNALMSAIFTYKRYPNLIGGEDAE